MIRTCFALLTASAAGGLILGWWVLGVLTPIVYLLTGVAIL